MTAETSEIVKGMSATELDYLINRGSTFSRSELIKLRALRMKRSREQFGPICETYSQKHMRRRDRNA